MIANFQGVSSPSHRIVPLEVGYLLLFLFYLFFPSAVWWLNDEPQLIGAALQRLNEGIWWGPGLSGPTGNPYGPLPIFIYQLLLKVTSDLPSIVFVKTLFGVGAISISLLASSRLLRLPAISYLFVIGSPFIYVYTRSLWDNCFLIPISGLWHLAYLKYLHQGKRRDLFLWAVCGLAALHIHLMSLIALIPMTIGIAILEKNSWRRHWKFALGLFVICVILSVPYLSSLFQRNFSSPYRERLFLGEALFSPVAGLRVLNFAGFFEYFTPSLLTGPAGLFLKSLAWGTALTLIPFMVGIRRGWEGVAKDPKTVRSRFFLMVVGEFVATIAVFIFMRTKLEPHYANATWFAYWFIVAFGIESLMRIRAGAYFVRGLIFALLTLLAIHIVSIIKNQGDRGPHYGPTLGEQMRVAHELPDDCSLKRLTIEAEPLLHYPQAMEILCRLYGRDSAGEKKNFILRYQDEDSGKAMLEVVER